MSGGCKGFGGARHALALVALLALLAAGCARTQIDSPECACVVGACDAQGRCVECNSAADCADGLECTTDACIQGRCQRSADHARCQDGRCDPDLGCVQCISDADCNDGLDCSLDYCVHGSCRNVADDSRCTKGRCQLAFGCSECQKDADCRDGIACTLDTCVDHRCSFKADDASCPAHLECDPSRGCVGCQLDSECSDGIACTQDACLAGVCSHTVDEATCSATQHCDAELGCIVCRDDDQCQDGLTCNGRERCVAHQQCAPAQALTCDDGVACTIDTCSELNGGCYAQPDSSLCPSGEHCLPLFGCSSRQTFYANSPSDLYLIDLSVTPATALRIGALATTLGDIAQFSDGRLFGISFDKLYVIDPATAALNEIGPLNIQANGLTVAPDGTLYASSGPELYRVDPTTAVTDFVGNFGGDIQSSGDIVWGPFGAIFLSDAALGADRLVSLNPLTAQATPVGSIGFANVFGLSFSGGSLLGLTAGGELLRLDPVTGAGQVLQDFNIAWWGAS